MSTDAAPTTSHRLTQGGLHLILGLFRRTEAFKKAGATKRALQLWRRLKQAFPTTGEVQGERVDFTKSYVRSKTDTDVEWAQKQKEHADAWDAWESAEVNVALNLREKKIVLAAIQWALKDRTGPKAVWPHNNEHILSILEAFPEACIDVENDNDDEDEANDE